MSRHCTMLKIPKFRDWYESRYGNLCEQHDIDYELGEKWHGDKKLFTSIWFKNTLLDKVMAVLTFAAVQLPWVWVEYLWKKNNE